jgi:transcriptional regulator with XRE-family HTH domain
MASLERAFDRGSRKADRSRRAIGDEFREARLAAGWTQAQVAAACRMSRSRYTRIEAGSVASLSIDDATRIASVLGLDLSVRVYPGSGPLRDSGHAARLRRNLELVRPPLAARREVPLPARADRVDQRARDAMVAGDGRRTAIELEMRIRDAQALERRLGLKRRDDALDGFVLVVADTRRNRATIASEPGLFADLPRLRAHRVIAALEAGVHPPSALIFL